MILICFLQLLTNNNNNLPTLEKDLPICPDPISVTTTGVPGVSDDQRLEISTRKGKSFRTFKCLGDVPTSYSEYEAEISDIKGDWWGKLYYDGNGFPTFELNWVNPNNKKYIKRKIVTRKEFTEMPSPTGDAPWARYPVYSDEGQPQFRYVERAVTRGGVPPASCEGKATLSVPYEAYYYFYLCRDAKVQTEEPATSPVVPVVPPPSPVVPPPTPVVPSPAPVATAPPTPTGVTSPSPSPTTSPSSSPEAEVNADSSEDQSDGSGATSYLVPLTLVGVFFVNLF